MLQIKCKLCNDIGSIKDPVLFRDKLCYCQILKRHEHIPIELLCDKCGLNGRLYFTNNDTWEHLNCSNPSNV